MKSTHSKENSHEKKAIWYPRKNSKLTDEGKQIKFADGGGLFLLVKPIKSGIGKYWRYSYKLGDKHSTLGLGSYPDTSLAEARRKHEIAHELVAQGKHPSGQAIRSGVSFADVANEFYELKFDEWSSTHADRCRRLLDQHIIPGIGAMAIHAIEPPDVLETLKKMERKGIVSSMHKAKVLCGQVFRYGVAKGVCKRDQTADLKGALKKDKVVSHAALTDPEDIKRLLFEISEYHGSFYTRKGLFLMAHLFVRSGELRNAKRKEFDLKKGIWSIPLERMKNGKAHHVPLSNQVVEILNTLMDIGISDYILPAIHTNSKPMSENTLNVAIRRMGFTRQEMTCHGFRAMASTRLNEMGYNPDAIEAQLSHVEGNSVRAAYNRGLYWDERVKMMQEWSDYLARLCN